MSRWNLFDGVLRLPPSRLYLVSLAVAVVLALASLGVGAGWISADVAFEFAEGKTAKTRDIPLGYLQQLNFGPWNLLFCPVLLAAAGMTATLTDQLAPEELKQRCSFFCLGRKPSVVMLSAALLVAFLAQSLLVELTTYQSRGLGWVQVRSLLEAGKSGKPARITSNSFSFVADDDGELRRPIAATVLRVQPDRARTPTQWEMRLLIIAVKTWVGFWEGLVVYLGFLALLSGIGLVRSLDPESLRASSDETFGLGWVRLPTLYMLVVATLINIFHAMRFVANINKASYGVSDQFASLVTLAPGIVLLGFGTRVLCSIHLSGREVGPLASSALKAWFGIWSSTLLFVLFLVTGYIDSASQKQVVAVIQKISPIR